MSGDRPTDQPACGLRVLLVEDESLVALMLEEMLTDLGHTVVGPVARVSKAVDAARREAVDVAILDVNLNGEQVYPVAEALDQRGVPYIFSTGYGTRSLRTPYCDRPILQKPFRQPDLLQLLAEVCPPAERIV